MKPGITKSPHKPTKPLLLNGKLPLQSRPLKHTCWCSRETAAATRFQDFLARRVYIDAADQRHIELGSVQLEVCQQPQSGVTVSEIASRRPEAHIAIGPARRDRLCRPTWIIIDELRACVAVGTRTPCLPLQRRLPPALMILSVRPASHFPKLVSPPGIYS